MRIVHYSLGFFPNRAGGLNRYATDLMIEQSKKHDVALLMPGRWNPFYGKCWISNTKKIKGVNCYYLNNALPQPLLYGIKKPIAFIDKPISQRSFELFYKEVKPDVIHVHTFMGLPEKALLFFKNKGVKIVYTSHDYFGICPKVNLIDHEGKLCDGPRQEKCYLCNMKAPSALYLRIRSSSLTYLTRDFIRWLKSTKH